MTHKVIVTQPPPGLVATDEPSVTVSYSPSHTLTEAQQEKQYGKIVKLVDRIIAIASAAGSLPDDE